MTYTHGYKNPDLSGLTGRTIEKHAFWLMPHLKQGSRVLDAGSGPGTITLGLAEAVNPGMVTGVEIGKPYVELAIKNATKAGVENVEFIQGDALHLIYPDATFDVVFSFALLEHLPEPMDGLNEWLRILKPGGILAVGSSAVSRHAYPSDSPLSGKKIHFYMKIWERNGGHPELGLIQPQLVKAAGFTDIQVGGFYDANDAPEQALTWPDKFRDKELVKQVEELGVATEEEVLRVADEVEAIGNDDDAWYLRAWFWALAKKPS